MSVHRIHHVTLRVDDLPRAEAAYRDVFEFDVLFREGTYDGEFGALPADLDWPGAIDAGVTPGMTFLGDEDAAIAIAARDDDGDGAGDIAADDGASADDTGDGGADAQPESTTTALDHVALHVDPGDVTEMAARARDRGWTVDEREDAAFLVDADGIEWEVNASDPPPATPFDELPVS